jgi:nitrite reductase/ring-hydroxylating ferredoxin subunit/DMSO/TMAO reductase YedYZ heme-binding membrane subunit
MSHSYQTVGWTAFKRRFDTWMLAGAGLYLLTFVGVSSLVTPDGESFTPLQMLIRATGTLAFLQFSFVLIIGPLARLTPRFKPFLYNRRHLGVFTFVVGLAHGVLVLIWYHGFGVINPLLSLLVSNPRYDSLGGFPFEALGLVALVLLFLMAATSHDFWNANLGPRVWKALHMAGYVAYALLVAHVALGALLAEPHPVYFAMLAVGCGLVAGLHVYTHVAASGAVEAEASLQGWLAVGPAAGLPDGRARVVQAADEQRIAVFRDGAKISAVSNVCRHQGGPLGEGRIVDGCITCPWHGYQYRPEDGCSPPPFTERIATFATRIERGVVYVNPEPLPPGTWVAPSLIRPVND